MIREMYRNVKTSVRSTVGRTENVQVGVGLHQGSSLRPPLFNIVWDVLKEDVREEPPWCLLYADDIVLVAENREELEGKLERWRYALERRGLRISRKKTEYMTTKLDGNQQTTIKLGGGNIKRVHKFKYLGSVIDNEENMEEEINNRIQCSWNNWRKVSGVIWDRKDRARNEHIRDTVKATETSKKVQGARLRRYGHLMRREEQHMAREVMDVDVEADGTRRRGRPKTRWRVCIRNDMREKGVREEMTQNRGRWQRLIKNSDSE
ncbi:uncharacterized protein LOC135222522 [Macrobrachium nipponense]|uniref:uncharacterized protein LOC135222522 n=1 Tax=Macrobrachium nipponense TaxID=159736 RepID=UPI0030C868F0